MNSGIPSIPISPVSQTGSSLVPAPQLDISRYALSGSAKQLLILPVSVHLPAAASTGHSDYKANVPRPASVTRIR
jgi:hypothetical protein